MATVSESQGQGCAAHIRPTRLSNDGLTASLPSRARGVFHREMQRLIGYFQPSGSLNYVAECQSPADSVLREGYDVLVPGAHLHRLSPDTQVTAAKSPLCPLARLRRLFSCRLLSYMT